MLSVTSAQLEGWLALLAFPMARILGFVGAAPVFGNNAVPRRIKLMVGLAITLGLLPVMPSAPPEAIDSWAGILMLFQQTLIGIAMGLVLRVVFAALDLMGEIISLQMGLSFATFFDPVAGGQTAVVGEFLTLIATLVFLSLNGHLLMIDALARSFEWLPVSATLPHKGGWLVLARFGASIFASGLLMALPIVTALLITNIALGVLTRAAPQLNLFAIGFPITLTVGFGVLLLALGHLAPLLQYFYDAGFTTLADLLRANDRKVTIEEIQKRVAEHFSIRFADMHSPRRARAVARPRQVAMYLAKQLTSRSLPEIGRKFGGRDHTTVMHAVRKIEELREIDSAFAEDIDLLRRKLEG